MYVEKSNHISFRDFTVIDAPFWTLHPAGCDDVLIDKIRILNDLDVANSDGIDPDHCSNVRILGCHVTCADDCICLKASKGNSEYGPCENIIIDGCTLISTSAAIKIGTEGVGDFKNVIVSNCIISRSNRGLSIQIRDGGSVENVSYSNIIIETRRFCPDWWGTAEPIVITTFNRDENTKSGTIKNVRFFNVTAKGENGVLIHGNDENIIEDSRLKEMNFGDYEGEYIQDLKKKHDYFCLWHQPQLSFSLPNGETYEEVVFRLNDFILEKYNEDPQQTIFITIHGMLFTILHGIFLDLPVERLNEVNQEIVRGCSLSLFEFDGKKHKIDFIGKDCFLTPLKEKISYK